MEFLTFIVNSLSVTLGLLFYSFILYLVYIFYTSGDDNGDKDLKINVEEDIDDILDELESVDGDEIMT